MAQQSPAAQHLPGAMRKIPCPRCGTINLEKFVTFPHCANCGTLLPSLEAASPEVVSLLQRVWQRPLLSLLWMAVLGCATLALAATTVLFEAAPEAAGQVVIYGQLSRVTQPGHLISAQFTVDTMDAPTARPEDVLSAVTLRIPRRFFNDFEFITLDPPPDKIIDRGTGRYFHYAALPRETRLQLSLRARAPGRHRLDTQIYAADYSVGKYGTVITVQPGAATKSTVAKSRGK